MKAEALQRVVVRKKQEKKVGGAIWLRLRVLWLGHQDSNLNRRSQNPVSYH